MFGKGEIAILFVIQRFSKGVKMNWIMQAYADVYRVTLGQSDVYASTVKCNKHLRTGEKTHRQRPAK